MLSTLLILSKGTHRPRPQTTCHLYCILPSVKVSIRWFLCWWSNIRMAIIGSNANESSGCHHHLFYNYSNHTIFPKTFHCYLKASLIPTECIRWSEGRPLHKWFIWTCGSFYLHELQHSNGCTNEFWGWISNVMAYFIMNAIIHSCWLYG